jgi:hypothetical protein
MVVKKDRGVAIAPIDPGIHTRIGIMYKRKKGRAVNAIERVPKINLQGS